MITVLESIKLSTQFLTEKGIETPRANAEILLADILNCKRLDLYLLFDRPLTEVELQHYRDYLKSRSNFKPLQYILGKVEFYGLELNVNESVLVPRPETELLVENIINQCSGKNNLSILDIGCGSGLFLSMLQDERAEVHGIELDGARAYYAKSRHQIKITKRKTQLIDIFQNEKCAFVAQNDLDFGMTRLHGAHIDGSGISSVPHAPACLCCIHTIIICS